MFFTLLEFHFMYIIISISFGDDADVFLKYTQNMIVLAKQLARGFKIAFGVEKRLRIGEVYLYESRGCVLHKKTSHSCCVLLSDPSGNSHSRRVDIES